MSKLFLETYGPKAQERLAKEITEVKGNNILAPVTVVLPTQYAGISLRRSLCRNDGLVNVRFMVPARLAEYLGSPCLAEQGKAPLLSIMELVAIRHFAGGMEGQVPLGGVAWHPRLHIFLRNTFKNLDRLSESGLASLEAVDPLRAQMVKWYRLYRSLLDHYYDREELSWSAADAVERGQTAGTLKDLGFIIFYLVSDFSPGEIALATALGKHATCAAILGLTGEDKVDALALLVASRLEPALGPAEYAGEQQDQINTADHLLVAPDAEEEVRWVIRHILRHAQDGLAFHRMAILYRHYDPYGFLLQSQLRFAKIPFAGPEPTLLRDTPAGKLLVYLLEVIESDFARDSVMRWIAEAPVKASSNGDLASGDLARWEIISRKVGIISGGASWKERLSRYRERLKQQIGEIEALEDASPAQLRGLQEQIESSERLVLFVQDLVSIAPLPEGSPWSAHTEWAINLLKQYAHSPADWPEEHLGSYERVITSLGELSSLDALEPGGTDLGNFRAMLDNILEKSAGRAGVTGTGIFVGSVASAQAMDFEAVYIVGMAEGSFPPKIGQDPLLPDQIRKELPDTESLPLRQVRSIEERRLFLAALASGRKRVLSFPQVDTSSRRGQYPSPWFLNAAEQLRGAPVRSNEIEQLVSEPWISLVHSSQHGLQYANSLAPADSHDYDMASILRWREKGHYLSRHFLMTTGSPLYRALAMEKGRRSSDFTIWDGRLIDMEGISHRLGIPSGTGFSPTRLERWAVCPFRYFLGDVLGISVLERPEEVMTISPMDRGSLLHRVMERFVTTAIEREQPLNFGESWTRSDLELLMGIAEEEFEQAEMDGITGRRLLWELAKEEMLQDLEALLQVDSKRRAYQKLRPLWAERKFGFAEENALPPVTLTLRNGTQITLRGVIDRVDTDAHGSKITVIDYKFGSSSSHRDMNKDPLGGGRRLQLPVYALAARNSIGDEAEVQALYWFASARGNFETKVVPLSEVEQRFHDTVETITTGIEQGLFPANPGTSDGQQGNCTYCDFDRVCPSDRRRLWERKSQNPDIALYLSLAAADIKLPEELGE